MASKLILITGANGVVGRLINMFLAPYHDIVTLGGSDQLNLTDSEQVNKFFSSHPKFDIVIHCAARGTKNVNDINPSIAWSNLTMYENIKNNSRHFYKLINLASGCELPSVPNRKETQLRTEFPINPYGMSKNIIARDVIKHLHWYNLRLFGLVSHTRVFEKVFEAAQRGDPTFPLTDRYMDYITESELERIILHYVNNDKHLINDVNMVPSVKRKVSAYIQDYIDNMGLEIKIDIIKEEDDSYTGDSTNLNRSNIL